MKRKQKSLLFPRLVYFRDCSVVTARFFIARQTQRFVHFFLPYIHFHSAAFLLIMTSSLVEKMTMMLLLFLLLMVMMIMAFY